MKKIKPESFQIHAVYLQETTSQFYNDFDPLVDRDIINTSQNTMRAVAIQVKENVFENERGEEKKIEVARFLIECGLRYLALPDGMNVDEVDDDDDDQIEPFIVAEITASFILEYIMKTNLSIEIVKEFGKQYPPLYVKPYWHEYCQSTCNRMMLPSAVLPMLKSY